MTTPIVVEQGPTGTTAQFEIQATGVTDLWMYSFWVNEPEPMEGQTNLSEITAITQVGAWPAEFTAQDNGDYWVVFAGPPSDPPGAEGTTVDGDVVLARVTVKYHDNVDPFDPGEYRIAFPNDQGQVSLVSYDLSKPIDERDDPIDHDVTVTNAVIDVHSPAAPTPNPLTWAAAPSPLSASSIEMIVADATDTVTQPENIEYQVELAGGELKPWQTFAPGDEKLFAFTGLDPNTAYTFVPRARDEAGNVTDDPDPVRPEDEVYTLANPPTAGAVVSVTPETIEVSWSANSNPAGTRYVVECDDDAAFTDPPVETSGPVTATTYTFGLTTPLTADTDYWIRVRALNEDGVPTANHEFADNPVHTPPAYNLDADDNCQATALSDGVMIVRHLFGFSGSALTDGAIAPDARRTDPGDIAAFLESGRAVMLDADDNGAATALS
ncbi:MAG: fibronectin type III domain-containing protein, partial [Planctomycetota bacterium]